MIKHILFVEDEEAQQDLFETAIDDWNLAHADAGRRFTFSTETTVEQAFEALARTRFDAALFDLRVKSKGGGAAGPRGNELARAALHERGLPVAIISANTGQLDDDVREAGAVRVFDKSQVVAEGNYYDHSLAWLAEQWEMMEVLSAARKNIEASAADIFLLRLWPRWKSFAELETDREELEGIVTRQYVGHMADKLGLDDPSNVSWHPFENYVSPALMSGRAHTGDIFRFDDRLWVVLTPQCDMATQKIENVVLATCDVGIDKWAENLTALKARASKNSVEGSTKFLRKFVNQNLEPSKHFLPPLPNEKEPLLVNFASIVTRPLKELNSSLDSRIASIATPFLANIVQRFGAYISRTGQPNIDMARL